VIDPVGDVQRSTIRIGLRHEFMLKPVRLWMRIGR
jgi:hypothetical protein